VTVKVTLRQKLSQQVSSIFQNEDVFIACSDNGFFLPASSMQRHQRVFIIQLFRPLAENASLGRFSITRFLDTRETEWIRNG
jgi:hypothetical protein